MTTSLVARVRHIFATLVGDPCEKGRCNALRQHSSFAGNEVRPSAHSGNALTHASIDEDRGARAALRSPWYPASSSGESGTNLHCTLPLLKFCVSRCLLVLRSCSTRTVLFRGVAAAAILLPYYPLLVRRPAFVSPT